MMPRLTTKYAKNYCNPTLIVTVIVENVVTFFGTRYIMYLPQHKVCNRVNCCAFNQKLVINGSNAIHHELLHHKIVISTVINIMQKLCSCNSPFSQQIHTNISSWWYYIECHKNQNGMYTLKTCIQTAFQSNHKLAATSESYHFANSRISLCFEIQESLANA